MLNNNQQNSPRKLKPSHQLAVDLRLGGYSYQEIASKVNSKEQTIRSWFMQEGICEDAFNCKNKILAEDRLVKLKQVEAGIQDLASDALRVIRESVVGGNLKAAIKVLEMVGFKSIQKIEEVQPQQEIDQGILFIRELITARREAARLDRLSNNNS